MASRLFSKINPIVRGKRPDEYYAEPYVTPGNIDGPDSPFYGRGGWTWYTGSATWLLRVGMEGLLGIRPTAAGLVVDPCIKPSWKGFSVRRKFRGALYAIEVKNPGRVSCGVSGVEIDDVPTEMNTHGRGVLLPLFPPGTEHKIVVTMTKRKH
jgi:cellobiose phosphorylase